MPSALRYQQASLNHSPSIFATQPLFTAFDAIIACSGKDLIQLFTAIEHPSSIMTDKTIAIIIDEWITNIGYPFFRNAFDIDQLISLIHYLEIDHRYNQEPRLPLQHPPCSHVKHTDSINNIITMAANSFHPQLCIAV